MRHALRVIEFGCLAHMTTYEVIRHLEHPQPPGHLSFVGGQPLLPPRLELPACRLCGEPQTFFFQIAFPESHPWAGKVLAVFACTRCTPGDYLTPSSNPPDDWHNLPDGYLDRYELNFRLQVFNANEPVVVRQDYVPVLRYERIELKKTGRLRSRGTRVGGEPYWYLSDDTPRSYMGSPLAFLMQLEPNWAFTKLPEAPPQAEPVWFPTDPPHRTDDLYFLFGGVPLYFFGTTALPRPRVYVLNQK